MKWFEGSITDAVTTSKSRKAIFVVFVEGKDDASVEVAQAINTPDVSRRLESEDFVSVRIEAGSESYGFFVEIYKAVPVPSIFFIGQNGTPLNIITGGTGAQNLLTKIDQILVDAGKVSQNASANLINAEQNAATASNSSATEKEVGKRNEEKMDNPVPENKSTTKDEEEKKSASVQNTETEIKSTSKDPSPENELTPEEKVERARKLIELQKKQRIEQEEKKELERELERRKFGKDTQKSRQRQQELEIKLVHEERMKEKAAEAAAKDRVRRQIEQDKQERKQKELALQQEKQKKSSADQSLPQAPVPSSSTVVRIQFRLPTGNPYTAQFEPTSTLGTLRTYILENIELPFQQFSMSTSFPRRDLTYEDDSKTLLQLELVPTAVILILPMKNSAPASAVTPSQDLGFVTRLVWTLFSPIIGVYNYIASYFTRGPRRTSVDQRRDAGGFRSARNADEPVSQNLPNLANSSLVRRYLGNQGGTKIRAEGNIHRLHSGGDNNDENNTWNGNSTQQM